MELNEVGRSAATGSIFWIEDSNTLIHRSQKLSEPPEASLDCNVLDSKFVCVEESEDIPSSDVSCSQDVDPLSTGLVKNEFTNCFASVYVTSRTDKNSLDADLLKEEDAYSPGSIFIPSEESDADVCTSRYDM